MSDPAGSAIDNRASGATKPKGLRATLSRNAKLAVCVYLASTAGYIATSGGRLRVHSNDNHYVRLADSWLHRRLDLGYLPPAMDDRAQVETLWLTDGRVLRGAMVSGTMQAFRTLKGEVLQVPPDQIQGREMKYYISFPPFPAVLMLPVVAIAGLNTNDVVFTVVLAGLAPALLFLFLRRLAARGDSSRSEVDDLWLTAILAFGSVYFYASVLGQVWYTAHVVSVILVLCYLHASLDARYPFWAGLALICGFGCRPEILFTAPFFLWQLLRTSAAPETTADIAAASRRAERYRDLTAPVGGRRAGYLLLPLAAPLRALALAGRWVGDGWTRLDKRRVVRELVVFAAPVVALGLAMASLNYLRFGRPTEFGHSYLQVRWTPRIQKFGLFNYAFLGRNLACLLALTPRLVGGYPWVQYSWHGLAIWVTTPVVLYLLWPKVKGAMHRPLWLSVAFVAIPELMYQNSGWVQFGYRFALDYFPMLIALLAVGGRPLTRRFKVLILIGVAVNLFGAITFGRMPQFSFDGYFPPGID
jgi:hypothetical protein